MSLVSLGVCYTHRILSSRHIYLLTNLTSYDVHRIDFAIAIEANRNSGMTYPKAGDRAMIHLRKAKYRTHRGYVHHLLKSYRIQVLCQKAVLS